MDQSEWLLWERGVDWGDAFAQATFTDEGLMLGAGTILARCDGPDLTSPEGEARHDRLIALLCVLKRGPVVPNVCATVAKAALDWRAGKKALAQIRLAFLRLPKVHGRPDAYRLHLAGQALALGCPPGELMKELGLSEPALALLKFNPRHRPKGPGGGQFAPDDDGGASVTPVQFAPFVEPLIGPLIDSGAARLAPRVAPRPIPPVESVTPKPSPRPSPVIEQRPDLQGPAPDGARKKRENPCPPEQPDVNNGSDRGKPYQRHVDWLANGANGTTDGMAYYLPNPEKGGTPQSFDICVKTNAPNKIPGTEMGDVVEAKNKMYDRLFTIPMFARSDTEKTVSVNETWSKFEKQVNAQYNAIKGTGRHLFYCFEGPRAAALARDKLTEIYPDVTFMQCQ